VALASTRRIGIDGHLLYERKIGIYLTGSHGGKAYGGKLGCYKNGFLPILSVEPQTGPDQSPATWSGGGSAYPTFNKLGVSTIWSNQTNAPEGSATFNITYYLVVSNNTDNDIAYSFLEADL
jgi:hypothetical protein